LDRGACVWTGEPAFGQGSLGLDRGACIWTGKLAFGQCTWHLEGCRLSCAHVCSCKNWPLCARHKADWPGSLGTLCTNIFVCTVYMQTVLKSAHRMLGHSYTSCLIWVIWYDRGSEADTLPVSANVICTAASQHCLARMFLLLTWLLTHCSWPV